MRSDKILPCVISVGPDAGGRRCGIHQVILSSTSLATIQSCCRFFAHLPIFRQIASDCEKLFVDQKEKLRSCTPPSDDVINGWPPNYGDENQFNSAEMSPPFFQVEGILIPFLHYGYK